MTYFAFLFWFLVLPLAVLALLTYRDKRSGARLPQGFSSWSPAIVVAVHVIVAVVYTTPWDNYLVANSVWWYDPALVTGVVIGWVPIEEYTFFVLQTTAMGLWLLLLARHLPLEGSPQFPANYEGATVSFMSEGRRLRIASSLTLAGLWSVSVAILLSGWQGGTYLALILVWAIPPMLLQLVFGADILWSRRRLLFWTLASATVYLCIADAFAISSGTWTIDPAQSTGLKLGVLPVEEMLFFLVTNIMVTFGITLLLDKRSVQRAPRAMIGMLDSLQKGHQKAELKNA